MYIVGAKFGSRQSVDHCPVHRPQLCAANPWIVQVLTHAIFDGSCVHMIVQWPIVTVAVSKYFLSHEEGCEQGAKK